ncbi:UNVERIFIED_CONTAM: Protein PIN-LIKES 1 [Sesamum indicum]
MSLLDLFRASSIPVLKVLLVTGLGSYLARDRIDILGDDARKHLNNELKTAKVDCLSRKKKLRMSLTYVFFMVQQLNKTELSERNAEETEEATRGSPVKVSGSDKIKQRLETLFKQMHLKRLFAPSTIGAIVGFVVGLEPQIRKLMIGDAAPLRVIQDTAFLLGDGAIPAVTLVMGGNLLKGLKGSGIQKSIILGILIVRYVALPLIGIGVVKGAQKLGLVHDNPLYRFVLLLQFSLPPAMNIGTMTQLFGLGESECSVIMLWCYALASVFLTLWSMLFLWLVS